MPLAQGKIFVFLTIVTALVVLLLILQLSRLG